MRMSYQELERKCDEAYAAAHKLAVSVCEVAEERDRLHSLLARIYRANYVPTADETFPNQEEIEKALGIGKEPK